MNNNRTGKGIYYYENGDVYEGDFLDNQFHGYGKFIFTNGAIDDGLWDNGKLIKSN
jgi:hypothetical protein